ncbi:MAG: hypothetical protein IK076_04410 [Bacteroidales bacterium]|nr:hypothetical protein [Bacteroidales bacterium]
MDNLEKYIRDNAESFNDAGLPEGHLERFIEKMDAATSDTSAVRPYAKLSETQVHDLAGSESESIVEHRRRSTGRTIPRMIWAFSAVAAALAAILLLNRPHGQEIDRLAESGQHKDWFAEVGNDQVEIYRAYYDKVSEMYELILTSHPDGSLDTSISCLAEESIPLIDQLPDEMDPEAKAAVLKEYYGELLDGLDRINMIK